MQSNNNYGNEYIGEQLQESLEPIAVVSDSSSSLASNVDSRAQYHRKLSVWRPNKTVLWSGFAILLATTLGVLLLLIVSVSRNRQDAIDTVRGHEYPSTQLPLAELTSGQPLSLGQLAQVGIMGRVTVNGSLILAPGDAPEQPVPGEIYYDQRSQQVYYYNGTNFTSLAGTGAGTFSLGGVSGQISLGSGLTISGNVLSGAPAGLTSVSGTVNQVNVVVAGDTVTLSLPQNISVESRPVFSGLELGDALIVAGSNAVLRAQIGEFATALEVTTPTANRVISLPDADGVVCVTSGNCAGVSGIGDVLQNGNSFGLDVTLGTNDVYGLNFETNGITRMSVENDGDVLIKNTSNSVDAFRVQYSDEHNLIAADTTNGVVSIGEEYITAPIPGLISNWYNGGTSLGSGTLANTVIDGPINWTNIGSTRPAGVNATNIHATWDGKIYIDFNETYTFYTRSDDGSRLYIDGTLVVESWFTQSLTERSGTIALSSGWHDIRAEYFNGPSTGAMSVYWESSSVAKALIPYANLWHTGTRPASMTIDDSRGFVGIRNSAPSNVLSINQLAIADTSAQLAISTADKNFKGIVIQGVSGQVGDLLQNQDSIGNILSGFSSSGNLFIGAATAPNKININTLTTPDNAAQVAVSTGLATNKGLVIQGAIAQTASLLEIQRSDGSNMLRVDSGGYLGLNNGLYSVNINATACSGGIRALGICVDTATSEAMFRNGNGGGSGGYHFQGGLSGGSGTIMSLQSDNLTGFTTKLYQHTAQTNPMLQIINSAGNLIGGFGATGDLFYLNNGSTLTLQAGALSGDQTITLPSASGTVCLTSGNCAGIGGTGDVLQNGNDFAAAMTIGTNDNYNLNLETNGVTQLSISSVGTASFSGDIVVAASRSLSLSGGNTASRPVAPTEGTIYYDTSTKQLLTYTNGKWQSDSKTATFIVAASNSSQAAKDSAQYVGNGEIGNGTTTIDGDQLEINSAITAANAAGGGVIYLMEGTYYLDAAVLMRSNISLVGSGYATYLAKATGTSSTPAITLNATDGSVDKIKIKNMRLWAGNGTATIKIDNASGATDGLELESLEVSVDGGGSASRVMTVIRANDVHIAKSKFTTGENGAYLGYIGRGNITGNIFTGVAGDNGREALWVINSNNVTVSQNIINSGTWAMELDNNTDAVIADNVVKCDTPSSYSYGIDLYDGNNNITISGNRISNCKYEGIRVNGTTVVNNNINISNNNILGYPGSTNSMGISSRANNTGLIISDNRVNQTYYGIYSLSSRATINSNNVSSTTSTSIYSTGSHSTINDNTVNNSGSRGINVQGAYSSITGNIVSNSVNQGIYLWAASNTVVSANALHDNGGTGAVDSLYVYSTSYAQISDNRITDTAGTGYAINIANISSIQNVLSNNSFFGVGAERLFDAGSNTQYVNQATSAQTLQTGSTLIKPLASTVIAGSIDPGASTSVTGVGTKFLSQLQAGDKIVVSGETRTIISIASDTTLTVDRPFSDNANDTTIDRLPAALVVRNSTSTKNVLTVNPITNTLELTSAASTGLIGFSEGFEAAVPPAGWTAGGDALWSQDLITFNGGGASANSGVIVDSQSSWIDYDFTLVGGDGELSFDWKVSSESGYDYLTFCLDNDACTSATGYYNRISGEIGWAKVIVPVTEGAHSFRWLYSKDSSVSSGTDEAWIDNISLPDNTAQNTLVIQNNSNSIDFFKISNNGDSTLNGNSLIRSRVNSTTAFQIQNVAGDSVVTADTLNGNLGVGTVSPTTTLHIAVNNSEVTRPHLLLEQLGSGDSTVEIKSNTGSWFAGIDASDGGSFKINSSSNASSSGVFGYTGTGNSVDTGSNTVLAVGKFTAGVSGTVSALNVHIGGDMDSSPNNQFRMALYADDGSGTAPGSLITESTSTAVSAGWNTVAVPGVSVTTGTVYWIGYSTNALDPTKNNPTFFDSGGTCAWTSSYSYGAMPATWPGTTGVNGACQKSVYATVQVAGAYDSYNAELFRLSANGALRLHNSLDSKTAFVVLNTASTKQALAVDTTTGGIGVNLDFSESMTSGVDISLGGSSDRVIGVNTTTVAGNGHNLTVQAGDANSGNNNGGDLVLQGGSGTGAGFAGSVVVLPQADSSIVFRIQNAAGTDDLLVADTINMVLTIKQLIVEENIKLDGHILAYDAPLATSDAVASVCTGTNVTVDGTDIAGNIEITTGMGCTAGQIAGLLFGEPYEVSSEPQVTLTPANASAADLKYYIGASTESGFTINTTNIPSDSTLYKFYYHVIQGRAPF